MVPIDICFMVCMSDALVRAEYLQQISKPLRFWFTTKRALSTDLICDIKSNKRWNSRHGYKQPIDLSTQQLREGGGIGSNIDSL